MKKSIVELTVKQRGELSHMISIGKAAARELTHARILLKADQGPQGPGWSDSRIQKALARQRQHHATCEKDLCAVRRARGYCAPSCPAGASLPTGWDARGVLDCTGV